MSDGERAVPAIEHAQMGASKGEVIRPSLGADKAEAAVIFRRGGIGALGIDKVTITELVLQRGGIENADPAPFGSAGLGSILERINVGGQ